MSGRSLGEEQDKSPICPIETYRWVNTWVRTLRNCACSMMNVTPTCSVPGPYLVRTKSVVTYIGKQEGIDLIHGC